jgi:ketosteroid isomerase-like protein
MMQQESDGVSVLNSIRNDWAEAEAAGDLAYLENALADDAVIMPPGPPVIEGRAACMEFIRRTAFDLATEFDRRISLTSQEIDINGTWAFDRGVFTQCLVRRETGEELQESGKYFWLYRRDANNWKLARVVGCYDWTEGSEEDAARTAS